MRMREGWEVWLLPNQATGRRGVPRYIKVDSATFSDEATLAEFDDTAQSVGRAAVSSRFVEADVDAAHPPTFLTTPLALDVVSAL